MRVCCYNNKVPLISADVAELADALDFASTTSVKEIEN